MGIKKWWNMLLLRLGVTEITPYGRCFYQYCQDIVAGKDVFIQEYELQLMDLWVGNPDLTREESAAAFIQYMNDNYDMEEV